MEFLKNFTTAFGNTVSKISFKAEKEAPQILLVVGVVGFGAALFTACKATLKLPEIIEEANEEKEQIIKKHIADRVESDIPTPEEKKETTAVYVKTISKAARIYMPTIILAVFSVGCIVSGQKILIKNNIALTAAYASLYKEFEEYRNNTRKTFGVEADRDMRFNLTDDNQEQETQLLGGGRYYFGPETSKYWKPSIEDNLYFLSMVLDDSNIMLDSRDHLFGNDILEMLGMEPTVEGHDNGWIKDKNVEHKIDFGIYYNTLLKNIPNETDGKGIWIEFNYDGNIRHCLKA